MRGNPDSWPGDGRVGEEVWPAGLLWTGGQEIRCPQREGACGSVGGRQKGSAGRGLEGSWAWGVMPGDGHSEQVNPGPRRAVGGGHQCGHTATFSCHQSPPLPGPWECGCSWQAPGLLHGTQRPAQPSSRDLCPELGDKTECLGVERPSNYLAGDIFCPGKPRGEALGFETQAVKLSWEFRKSGRKEPGPQGARQAGSRRLRGSSRCTALHGAGNPGHHCACHPWLCPDTLWGRRAVPAPSSG